MSDYNFNKATNKKSAYIYGGIIGSLVSILFMFIFAALLTFLNIDRAYAVPFATISVAVGSFISSLISARKIGDKGYLTGIIIGIVVFLIITVLSLVLGNNLSVNTVFHFIIIMLSSVAGGIMGVNKQKHKKYI